MSTKPQPTVLAVQTASLARDLEAYIRAWEEANDLEAETDTEVFSDKIRETAQEIHGRLSIIVKVTR